MIGRGGGGGGGGGGGAAFKGGEGGNLVENYAYIPSIDL